jgi:hypothetical protein
MEVAGDHIETASLNNGKEAAEAWVDKEVVFIVRQAIGHPVGVTFRSLVWGSFVLMLSLISPGSRYIETSAIY